MAKVQIDYKDVFPETMERMCNDGLLLVTKGNDNNPNIMTIGWGTIGSIWYKSIFMVLVRQSRYTYSRLEEVEAFTVNVPSKELAKAALHCGTVSGINHDKFKEMNLTAVTSQEIGVPMIKECHINYVCKSMYKNDLIPEMMDHSVKKLFYPKGDFHRLYFGEILAVYADGK